MEEIYWLHIHFQLAFIQGTIVKRALRGGILLGLAHRFHVIKLPTPSLQVLNLMVVYH